MNRKTLENWTPKAAENQARPVIYNSGTTAENRAISPFSGENTPRTPALSEPQGETSNAQLIAELTRAKCAFQLRTICAVMGVK